MDDPAKKAFPSAPAARLGTLSIRLAFCILLALLATLVAVAETSRLDDKWLEPARSRLLEDKQGMPFFPHRANTPNNVVLNAGDFDDAQVCGACHDQIYQQWRTSMMSHAWEEPIYRALLKHASEATEGRVDNFCTGCHTPIGLTTGQINSTVNRASVEFTAEHNPMPGVDCETCHNISARTGLDNGAYVLSPRAHGKPTKFGPRSDATSPYHDTVYSDLHTRSDFCATCHNVTHPFSTVAVERTYDEWLESPYSFSGQTCQSCHMPGFAGKAAIMGPERADVASHWFTGANAAVLEYLGQKDAAQRAREYLAKAAEISFESVPGQLVPGQEASVRVKVANVGAGHKLPTGFPEGREVWIDFHAVDAAGHKFYRLGAVREGATEPDTRNFKVHLGDKDGKELDIEVWNATQILSDNRILPKGYDVREFSFVVPADAVGPVTLTAELNYWPFPQRLVDYLLGANKLKVEVTRMGQVVRELPLGPPVQAAKL
ncbi:multiheme c-type cytochrome [Pseudomonas sp. JS3066]|jgi:hypothetical protein|uniref:multiheme c-type cytochrome n=1 Tax=unclassified Pseudomonas TaxID=196821 RepID=UPI002E7B6032|nr:multiheme c-type cytochrome [Pseudomonas sp. JS3066]WVK94387.1 multiheme c-type cytochrome [Pseudomonas sp. JS3066]